MRAIAMRPLLRQSSCTMFRRPLSTIHAPLRPIPNFYDRARAMRPGRGTVIPQKRCAGSFAQNARRLWHEYPFSMSLAAAIICIGAGSLVYVNYVYQSYIIGAFTAYPEEVAKKLRRALYYTNSDFDPKNASKYYRQALQVAEECGMDPLSDEIIGIKIKVAELMEKINNIPKAIEVLEIIARDCVRWEREFGNLDENRKKRTRLLAKSVAIHIKLGELYSTPYIWDLAEAESRLVWAVETILKEKKRRAGLTVKDEDEGPWVSDDEFGASLEALAHSYERKNNHRLAAPLFLQALTVKPVQDCHSVVLMNNLAAALAQQVPTSKSAPNLDAKMAGDRLVVNAREWAQKALDVAAGIAPPQRTEECDQGCAIALYNLGDFCERNDDLRGARRYFEDSKSLSRAIGFPEGESTCTEALHRIDKT